MFLTTNNINYYGLFVIYFSNVLQYYMVAHLGQLNLIRPYKIN